MGGAGMIKNATNVVLAALAVIGAIALVGVVGMWLMHASMMGGMMVGGMTTIGCGIGGLLFVGVIIAVIFLLLRRR